MPNRETYTRRELFTEIIPNTALGIAAISFLTSLFPQRAEAQQEIWIPHWDGSWKRYNPFGGLKFVPIPGLGSTSRDKESFRPILEQAIYPLGFDEHDVLPPSYRIDMSSPRLGLPFERVDSTQHPDVSLYNMHKLIELYERQFNQDRFVIIGHSLGGFLGFNLALMHQPRVPALITLNGAIKGADILPSSIDQFFASFVGGEGGQYLINRGQRKETADKVETDAKWLRQKGTLVISFQSTGDPIVTPHHGYINNSDTLVNGRKLQTLFSMRKWETSLAADYIYSLIKELQNGEELAKFLEQAPYIADAYKQHAAPLDNPEVIEQIRYIIESLRALYYADHPSPSKPKESSENPFSLLWDMFNTLLSR